MTPSKGNPVSDFVFASLLAFGLIGLWAMRGWNKLFPALSLLIALALLAAHISNSRPRRQGDNID